MANEDCVTVTATSGKQALALLEDTAFAVLLVDLVLPDMGGMEFLARAGRARPEAVKLLTVGRLDVDSLLEAVNKAGVFRILQKPWDGSFLRNSVRRAIVEHRRLVDAGLMMVRLNELNDRLQKLNRELDARVVERTGQLFLSLCNALDLRDTDTQWHSRRVALYAQRLAQELGITGEELIDIERGALLHDIGKIGVSDTILLKPGKLTEEEWVRMRLHADLGAQILKGIGFLDRARLLVQQHHERWDGQGYNQKLRGETIYVGARIFAVIDTYDAITSDRPYRKAQEHEVALVEIRKGRGSQFDPAVVEAFCRIPRAEIQLIRERASHDSDSPTD
jgi:putative nucleotidyltransferase with HDIG domain